MDTRRTQVISNNDFYARAQRIQFGSLSACRISASAHRLYCEVQPAPVRPATGPRKIHVHFQLRGHTQIEQGNCLFQLGPGDWSINAIPDSYNIHNVDAVEQLTIIIPLEDRPVELATLQGLSRIAHSSERGVCRVFQNFVLTSFAELQRLNAGTDVQLSTMMIGLFNSALDELVAGDRNPSSRQVIAERIKAIVAAHLSDPEFCIDNIARALRCTKRYVHLAFRECSPAETLSDYILRERLLRCRQALAAVNSMHKGISQVAFEWGFADPAYFSRVFRQYFGTSPRDFRLQCQQDLRTN
jgi:AraC-like DNA-binding protein